eukprot:jgi/Picsp_1/1492/NSC_04970-R1_bifunctional heparan sulfate n-deacetylase n-sulfotransferase 3
MAQKFFKGHGLIGQEKLPVFVVVMMFAGAIVLGSMHDSIHDETDGNAGYESNGAVNHDDALMEIRDLLEGNSASFVSKGMRDGVGGAHKNNSKVHFVHADPSSKKKTKDAFCMYVDDEIGFNCYAKKRGIMIKRNLYPIVLGIGPAKTSSTAVFKKLNMHQQVVLGDSSLKLQECCGPELYFFSRHFAHSGPYFAYGQYFDVADALEKLEKASSGIDNKRNKNILWLAEKTPTYHADFMAPHRISRMMSPSNAKLILTIRDPFAAHVSLFFHIQNTHGNATAMAFLEWSLKEFKTYEQKKSCLKKHAVAFGYAEHVPLWQLYQQVLPAYALSRLCIEREYEAGISSYMYSETIDMWINMMPEFDIICVFHEDLRKDCQSVMTNLFTMLGLEPVGVCDDTTIPEKSPEERLEKIGLRQDHKFLNGLRKLFQGEYQAARKKCEELDRARASKASIDLFV